MPRSATWSRNRSTTWLRESSNTRPYSTCAMGCRSWWVLLLAEFTSPNLSPPWFYQIKPILFLTTAQVVYGGSFLMYVCVLPRGCLCIYYTWITKLYLESGTRRYSFLSVSVLCFPWLLSGLKFGSNCCRVTMSCAKLYCTFRTTWCRNRVPTY